MATIQALGVVSDAEILADLQGLGMDTLVSDYHTVATVPTVTWVSAPSAEDQNRAAAYFQQNNPFRKWT